MSTISHSDVRKPSLNSPSSVYWAMTPMVGYIYQVRGLAQLFARSLTICKPCPKFPRRVPGSIFVGAGAWPE